MNMKTMMVVGMVSLGLPALAQEKSAPMKPEAAKPATATATTTTTTTATTTTAAAPKPASELGQVKFLTGNWSCTGKVAATPFGPEHPTKTTVNAKSDLDGFWVTARVDEKKTKQSPAPMKGVYQLTYDPAVKKFQSVWTDNMGGWAVQTGVMDAGTLSLEGDAHLAGQKMGSRDVFVKKSEKELVHTGEMSMNGKWMPLLEETCKKP